LEIDFCMELLRKDEAVESIEEYASVWKLLVGELPKADLTDRAGLSISWADHAFPFWNAVFLTEQLTDEKLLESRLREASAFMRQKRNAGLLYICEECLHGSAKESLQAILAKEMFELVLPIAGMAGDILPLHAPRHPSMRIERVTDATGLHEFADLNCEAYGFPLEWAHWGLKEKNLWTGDAYTYLGFEKDRAVSAASVVASNGYLYLALVATRPDVRGRGYAENTVRHALQAAHEGTGLTRTILHATDAGFPVYRRVGYHRTARIMTYKPPQSAIK
jgi:GNAT superfamily N-acetyltransferase